MQQGYRLKYLVLGGIHIAINLHKSSWTTKAWTVYNHNLSYFSMGACFCIQAPLILIIVLSRHSTHILMVDANNSRVIWRSWVWEHGVYKLKSPRQSVFQTSVLSIPKTMLLTEYYCVTLLFWESNLSVIISLQCWPALLFQHKHQEQL